jgi:hypothetical protein
MNYFTFIYYRKYSWIGIHWTANCNYEGWNTTIETPPKRIRAGSNDFKYNQLSNWWRNITTCTSRVYKDVYTKNYCSSIHLLEYLYQAVDVTFTTASIIMDTPLDMIFGEISSHIGNIPILLTIRKAWNWYGSRTKHHHNEIFVVCKTEYLNKIRHPFDIPGCLKQGEFAIDVLVRVMKAYQFMNAYNARVAQNKTHIMCVWDSISKGVLAKNEVFAFWQLFWGESND